MPLWRRCLGGPIIHVVRDSEWAEGPRGPVFRHNSVGTGEGSGGPAYTSRGVTARGGQRRREAGWGRRNGAERPGKGSSDPVERHEAHRRMHCYVETSAIQK